MSVSVIDPHVCHVKYGLCLAVSNYTAMHCTR